MRFLRRQTLLLLAFSLAGLAACGGGAGDGANNANVASNAAATNTNKANTNAEELGMLINFPWEAEDLAWKKDEAKKTLTAAFRLSAADAKKFSDQLAVNGEGTAKDMAIDEWFPAELVAQSGVSGNSTVPVRSFPATDLYQPPYSQGTVSRVEGTDYFVVEMQAP